MHGIEVCDCLSVCPLTYNESWYKHEHMVLTTPLVLTQPIGIVLVLFTYKRVECCP